MVTGLARLDGRVVGIVANQPKVRSGAIFVDSADKAARFISLCDAFNIPLVFLQDVPGFMVGVEVERPGHHPPRRQDDHRDGQSAEVPKYTRRAAQGLRRRLLRHVRARFRAARHARAAHRHDRPDVRAEASVNAVYANKIAAIDDADERAAFVAARTAEQQADINLLRMGSELVVDAVVEPERPARRARRPDGRRRPLDARARPPPPPDQPRLTAREIVARTTISGTGWRITMSETPDALAQLLDAALRPLPSGGRVPERVEAAAGRPRADRPRRLLGVGRPAATLVDAVAHRAHRRRRRLPLLRRAGRSTSPTTAWTAGPRIPRRPTGPPSSGRVSPATPARSPTPSSPTEVVRLAAGLLGLGVTKGDVVAIYMPNLVEAFTAIHACNRIGAIYTVLFSGFGEEAVASRLQAARARVVVVADASYRRGKPVPLLETLRAARATGPDRAATVVVVPHRRRRAAHRRRALLRRRLLAQAPPARPRCRSTPTSRRS